MWWAIIVGVAFWSIYESFFLYVSFSCDGSRSGKLRIKGSYFLSSAMYYARPRVVFSYALSLPYVIIQLKSYI